MRWVFITCLAAVLVAGLLVLIAAKEEPRYQGRTLSSWLALFGQSNHDRTNAASMAILAIGSKGVPVLLQHLTNEQSLDEIRLWNYARRVVPGRLVDRLDPVVEDVMRSWEAGEAINLLGVEAKSALPTLSNLLSKRAHSLPAAIGLAGMGHEGVVVLLQALTNQDKGLCISVATALADARSDCDTVVPALVNAVQMGGQTKEDRLLREAAGRSLLYLRREPDLTVAAISSLLNRPEADSRYWGAKLLLGFGTDAEAAVPQLLKACKDEDPEVCYMAKCALIEIDPEVARKAGVK